jgi:uncharacterized membrane protein
MDYTVLARAVHVLAVVVWIGGVSMATTAAIPAIRAGRLGAHPLEAFQAFESRFVWQARFAVILTGLSGLYMLSRLLPWDQFSRLQFWWMHAMVSVWGLFVLLLTVAELLFLHRRFEPLAHADPDRALAWLHRMHWVLLARELSPSRAPSPAPMGYRSFRNRITKFDGGHQLDLRCRQN